MKRIIAMLLILSSLVILLTGCGSKEITGAVYQSPDGKETIVLSEDGQFKMEHKDDKTSFTYTGKYSTNGTDIAFFAISSKQKDTVTPLSYKISEEGYLLDTSKSLEVKTYKKTDGYIYILLYSEALDRSYLYVLTNEDGSNKAFYYDSTMVENAEPEECTYTQDGNVYFIPERGEYIYVPADGSDPSFTFFKPASDLTLEKMMAEAGK